MDLVLLCLLSTLLSNGLGLAQFFEPIKLKRWREESSLSGSFIFSPHPNPSEMCCMRLVNQTFNRRNLFYPDLAFTFNSALTIMQQMSSSFRLKKINGYVSQREKAFILSPTLF